MGALHHFFGRHTHIVAQVVEAEFAVRTESDVAIIGSAAFFGIGLCFVDTSHADAVEHVERSHPFRVALGKVVVHGHHVHTVATERIEKHGKRTHEGFTFTGSHFGDFALVEHDTANELHIVVNHIPSHLVAASHPVVVVDCLIALNGEEIVSVGGELSVEIGGSHLNGFILSESARRIFHDSEHFGKCVIEFVFDAFEHLFFEFVDLRPERLTFFKIEELNLHFNFCNFVAQGLHGLLNILTDSSYAGAQFIVGERLDRRIYILDFLKNRAQFFQVAVAFATEERF